MSEPRSQSRRRLLGGSALVVGGLLVAPAYVTAKERQRRLGDNHSHVFTASQKDTVRALCDTILPETDTPGALTAKVDEFLSDTLELWSTPPERRAFLDGLDAFATECRQKSGRSFSTLSAAERLAYLGPLDREAVDARRKPSETLPFFATVKQLTLIGYYTSEVGCNAIGYVGPMGTLPGPDGPLNTGVWI